MSSTLIETKGGWQLAVEGWTVTRCFLDALNQRPILLTNAADVFRHRGHYATAAQAPE